MDRHDIRMVDRCERSNFPFESSRHDRIRRMIREQNL